MWSTHWQTVARVLLATDRSQISFGGLCHVSDFMHDVCQVAHFIFGKSFSVSVSTTSKSRSTVAYSIKWVSKPLYLPFLLWIWHILMQKNLYKEWNLTFVHCLTKSVFSRATNYSSTSKSKHFSLWSYIGQLLAWYAMNPSSSLVKCDTYSNEDGRSNDSPVSLCSNTIDKLKKLHINNRLSISLIVQIQTEKIIVAGNKRQQTWEKGHSETSTSL